MHTIDQLSIAFGIFKLVIGCIAQDTISTDNNIEEKQVMKKKRKKMERERPPRKPPRRNS
jgi:translation elongation factor EF-1beta